MMLPSLFLCVVTLATLQSLSLAATLEPSKPENKDKLPKCPYDTEVQFYTAAIDILDLPEACHEERHLNTIGFLLQDVVHSCEDLLPEYKEEQSKTKVCPFPMEVEEQRRNLRENNPNANGNASQRANPNSSSVAQKRRRYKYGMVGSCRRCRKGMNGRTLEANKNDVCSMSEEIVRLREETKYAATSAQAILASMQEKAAGSVLPQDDADIAEMLTHAIGYARQCVEANEIATKCAETASRLCEEESLLESSQSTLQKLVEIEFQFASMSVTDSKTALARIRQVQRDLDVRLHLTKSDSRRLNSRSDPNRAGDLAAGNDVCSVSKQITHLREEAKNAATTAQAILASMKEATAGGVLPRARGDVDATEILTHAIDYARDCLEASEIATKSAETVARLCEALSQLESSESSLQKLAEIEFKFASMSVANSKAALARIRQAQRDLDVLLHRQQAESRRLKNSFSSSNADTSSPSGSEAEYVERLSSNLEASNTACEQVKEAMIQKTIAQETSIQGDEVYDEVMKVSLGHEGNANVKRIKYEAELAHLQVRVEATKAIAAADLASLLCAESSQLIRYLRTLPDDDELKVAETGVVDSRLALSQLKAWRDEMEEVIALAEFDPVMSGLDGDSDRDETVLEVHKNNVETEIIIVESQLRAVPTNSSEAVALENKKESLVAEEVQIEEALENEEEFDIGQSALKKDEMYDALAPDFDESPPLRYVLRFTKDGNNMTVEKNWNPENEAPGSKAEWFRKLGDMVVVDVPRRLMLIYNSDMGGCVTEDSELSVVVVVTEVKSVWEAPKEECEVENVIPEEVSSALAAKEATSSTLPVEEEDSSVPLPVVARQQEPSISSDKSVGKKSKGGDSISSLDGKKKPRGERSETATEATTEANQAIPETTAESVQATPVASAGSSEASNGVTVISGEATPGNQDCTVEIKGRNAYWAGINVGFDSSSATLDFSRTGLDLSTVTVQKGVFESAVVVGQTITLTKPGWVSKRTLGYFDFNANGNDALKSMSPPKCMTEN